MKKKMKQLARMLALHWTILPFSIMIITDQIISNKNSLFYHSVGFIIAILWMFILGKVYFKKIDKVRQEIDADKYE